LGLQLPAALCHLLELQLPQTQTPLKVQQRQPLPLLWQLRQAAALLLLGLAGTAS
jgi:hypothetical protein